MPDTQLKDDSIKQKVKIGLLVVILAVVGWQVKGLFSGGGSPSPEPKPVSKPVPMTSNAPTETKVAANTMPSQPQATSSPSPESLTVVESMAMNMGETNLKQQENNQEYLSLINKLEMLKLEKEIA